MASASSPLLSLSSLLSLLSLLSFFFLLPPSAAAVSPSNNSAQLAWTDHLRFSLLPSNLTLVPLTHFLVNQPPRDLATFNITGNLVPVDASNSLSVGNPDIAVISCDDSAYPGRLDADQTVSNVVSADRTPYAVILYSTSAAYCNYNTDGPVPFRAIFSLLNPHAARNITSQISHGDSHPASIIPMSFVTAPPANSPGGDSGDDPNAAMIILYSITGIITALFLGIIITGAVRAHRHPERYGPRYTPGRPRQSRARGVARAMVETIPIVKFGDSNDGRDVKNDVELAMDPESEHAPESRQTENIESRDEGKNLDSEASEQKPGQEGKGQEGNFACPICTDDFVKGQDLRVLPCNHSFHPDCIDPWLVNVSGTCPLCRIDLNPEQENDEEEGQEQEGQRGEPSEQADESRQHRGIATYLHNTLNERRMRDASVEERIAALRRVREANREGNGDGDGRGTLTARVRDRFRIRTRAHA